MFVESILRGCKDKGLISMDDFLHNIRQRDFLGKNSSIRIGFCFEFLDASQGFYNCARNINKYISRNNDVDFSIWFEEITVPCLNANCGKFYLSDISQYIGNIIMPSAYCYKYAKFAPMSRLFYYIQDIEEERNYFKDHKLFYDMMKDDSIVKFARSRDIKKRYLDMGFKISDDFVEDYDIDKIIKIVRK